MFRPTPTHKPPRYPDDATLSASFDFFRAFFRRNLYVSSSSQSWGTPPPSMSVGMCFPLRTFKICPTTEGALGRSRGESGFCFQNLRCAVRNSCW